MTSEQLLDRRVGKLETRVARLSIRMNECRFVMTDLLKRVNGLECIPPEELQTKGSDHDAHANANAQPDS